jgi:hypothetical protein
VIASKVLIAPLAALVIGATGAAGIAGGDFDGPWRVTVVSDPGCTDRYDVAVRVEDGSLRYESMLMSAFGSGTVSKTGSLSARIANVRINGKLFERSGRGKWRSPDCTGTWTARRA